MTKMAGSSCDHSLRGTNIAPCEQASPSPLKALESSNIVFILASFFLFDYFLRTYLSKLFSSYRLKHNFELSTTDLVVSSSSYSEHGFGSRKYDVFISFRGADTRNNFVSHLYEGLCRKKIEAYKDDEKLPKGDEISPTLLEAIENSKISIVVLSENYATSRWCLDELVHILKCKHERGQIVLPIFYRVLPSDVRGQKKSYASAFVKHEKRFKDDMEKVLWWRWALKEIGNLSGWDTNENWPESELVDRIAHDVLSKLQDLSSTLGEDPFRNLVGMEGRFMNFEFLLCIDSPDVRVIGIWGMGGIGKSTLAEIVLKRLSSRFDSCFFKDVSNEAKRRGLQDINKKLYASLLKEKDVDMNKLFNVVRLRRTKALVILDNVDDDEQLEKLIGDSEEAKARFGEGSRIIITSRDYKLLKERADHIYKLYGLASYEANELFDQYAFGKDSSKSTEYRELSKRIVDYAGGNPLALKVLGSYLHSRTFEEWKSQLSELRKSPNKKVQEVLKVSYDELDRVKQSIFLDIACFLKGEDRKVVEDILEENSHIAISVLLERSLITIVGDKICMHDLIQEMAWEVVRRESVVVGERSRLWDARDVYSVLKRNKGSARIEGLSLNLSEISSDLWLRSKVFEDMENLRFLKIYNSQLNKTKIVYINQGLDYLPDSLRCLHWENYPLKSLPSDFKPQNLIKLDMRGSKLEKLWNEVQDLENLKEITLSRSVDLIELPDFSRAPELAVMNVEYSGIEALHTSLDLLKNLEYVNLDHCERLTSIRNLPRNVKSLHLRGCTRLFTNVEDDGRVSNFGYMEKGFGSVWHKLHGLHSLTLLSLGACGISHIPDSIDLLFSLESLYLQRNDFERIPESIKHMYKLKVININLCRNLESVSDLPPSLEVLGASDCDSLRMISVCGLTLLERVNAARCNSLEEFSIDEHGCTAWEELKGGSSTKDLSFSFGNCEKLKPGSHDKIWTLFRRQVLGLEFAFLSDLIFKSISPGKDPSACYYGNEIPEWFTYQSEGASMNLKLYQRMNFVGVAASVVVDSDRAKGNLIVSQMNLKACFNAVDIMDWNSPMFYLSYPKQESKPHVFMWHCRSGIFNNAKLVLLDGVIEMSFEFKLNSFLTEIGEIKITKCGIHLISQDEVEEFGFHSPAAGGSN